MRYFWENETTYPYDLENKVKSHQNPTDFWHVSMICSTCSYASLVIKRNNTDKFPSKNSSYVPTKLLKETYSLIKLLLQLNGLMPFEFQPTTVY